MEVVYERCCGLDVHKRTVVACVIVPGEVGQPTKELRTFATMTDDLLKLADWLAERKVTHVAMESTSVYWKPVWNLLEGSDLHLLLVNAQQVQAVPGRKTDAKDCEWLADLLRHGLLRGSFVPDQDQRELRELTRYRTALIRERSAEVNRLQKVLEGANIKLAAVATDIMGKSGREMLAALVAGATDPVALADLAKGRLREKIPQLERALAGRFGSHQRFLIGQQLAHIDALDETIQQVSTEIGERLRPFADEIARLDTIPGIDRRGAEGLIAEIGTELGSFPDADHLASWAGMVPGNNESAGKRKSGKTRKGDPWLRCLLVEAGQAAGRSKTTYLGAQYRRLAARRGKKKAAVAVGHSILVIAYYVLTRKETYQDLGPHYFDERDRERVKQRLVHRLEDLGYGVTVESRAPAA
jgi:transposase